MDDLENIFSNMKLNSDNSSDGSHIEKYLEEIDIALKKNETTSKWLKELKKDHCSVTDDEFNKLVETSKSDDDLSSNSDGALRYSVVELIAKRCLQIEIKILRDEFRADDTTALVKFINEHKAYYADKEYMVGFRYVVICLAIKGQLKEIRQKNDTKQFTVSGLQNLLKTLNEYQHFGIQQQVGVLAIKQYFGGNLLKNVSHDFQLRTIRDMVKMDPENLEWRFCLYSVLRFKRTANEFFSSPSQDEMSVIIEAFDKRYAVFDARICLGYAFCLAELFKSSGKMFAPIKYGRKTFYSEAEVLGCIRAKVDDVLAIDPTSVRSNIDVAKIYSSVLPYNHRDTAFATICIKRALMFHPNSSKANHRMAALLISTNSPNAAVEYLQKAVENDEGTADLLKVYMANIPQNKMKMEQIFSNPTHKIRNQYSEILLLEAVYSYFNGNSQKSVDLLIEAVNNNAKCIDSLERLHSTFKRFNWGEYNSFSKGLKKLLELRMAFCRSSEKEILTKIWKSLKESKEYGNNREQFKSGRSSYGSGRGSRSYQSGGYSYDSGHEDKSGGSKSESCEQLEDYAVLGLSKPATQTDIKKQYRELAREHHPDKNMHLSPDELLKKQEMMKRINSAYTALMSK